MNKFELLKKDMLMLHPSIKDLPFWQRLRAYLRPSSSSFTLTTTFPDAPGNEFKVTALLVEWRGKEYVKRFGK